MFLQLKLKIIVPIIGRACTQICQCCMSVKPDKQSANAPEVAPWVHFVAGGIAGMSGSIFTSPLDVIKTRMQSDVYRTYLKTPKTGNVINKGYLHIKDTFSIIQDIYKVEGPTALFRGLGPNLAGVVPARATNFFTYRMAKHIWSPLFNDLNQNSPQTHLMSGLTAGFATATVTNPIWLIKTRMQLDKSVAHLGRRQYRNSFDCLFQTVRTEGFRALYKGLSASFLGSVETATQWMLYERIKSIISKRQQMKQLRSQKITNLDKFLNWFATSGAAGFAKFVASLVSYPHEVVRTRLRQAPLENGRVKYTGLINCFRKIIAEEGLASLYGGLTPHLIRTVPNNIIMFGTWDLIIRCLSK